LRIVYAWKREAQCRNLSTILERQRSVILHRLTGLGDLRRGPITTASGRCGKPNCHCHRPNEPPHGPTDRLTWKVKGKTVSESLPIPSAIAKSEREVAEFRKYQQLSQQFVDSVWQKSLTNAC
jgi:hypothetical protein